MSRPNLVSRILRFASCRRGNVAIVFSFALLPLVTLTGFVMDYARATALRTEMQTAADAAVLAAVSARVTGTEEQAVVEKVMKAHLPRGADSKLKTLTVTSRRTDLGREITVAFTAESKNLIGSLIGSEKLVIASKATALQSDPAYSDITFVLDKSASMLLAASNKDREDMERITRQMGAEECAFACHRPIFYDSKKRVYYGPSSTEVAHNNGVRLRIDVMTDAVKKIINDLKAEQALLTHNTHIPRYLVTLVEFGSNWQFTQTKSQNPNRTVNGVSTSVISTSDLTAAASAVDTVEGVEWEWTNYNTVWHASNGVPGMDHLKSSGDGLSESSRTKQIVFVTDGVADYYNSGGQRKIETINPGLCAPVKAKKVTLIVLYTRYYRLPKNSFYMNNVDPWFNTIETELRKCASDGMFITADNEVEMNSAFKRIFTVLNGTRTRLSE